MDGSRELTERGTADHVGAEPTPCDGNRGLSAIGRVRLARFYPLVERAVPGRRNPLTGWLSPLYLGPPPENRPRGEDRRAANRSYVATKAFVPPTRPEVGGRSLLASRRPQKHEVMAKCRPSWMPKRGADYPRGDDGTIDERPRALQS